MKKFVAIVVWFCAMMISSTSSASVVENYSATDNYISYNFDKFFIEFEREEREAKAEKERREKEARAHKREIYALIGTIILTVSIISAFFVYKYLESRQFIAENSIKTWLLTFIDEKNFWAFIFFVISFVSCILYVPYNMVNPSNQNVINKTAYSTLFELPKDFRPQVTHIDYQRIAFREFLILLGCCAGYTVSNAIKKKS